MEIGVVGVIVSVLGTGAALAALILTGQHRVDARMSRLEDAIRALTHRVARLEGAFDARRFLSEPPAAKPDSARLG